MFTETVLGHLPSEWSYTNLRDYNDGDYKLVELSSHTSQYRSLQLHATGSFSLGVSKIVRVENPYLYGQFLIQQEEYKTRGQVRIVRLYHDTGVSNIPSIVRNNFDWRMANDVKYCKGVSFSPLPSSYAYKESSRNNNGIARAMIIADVLVQRVQCVDSVNLPNAGFDTTLGGVSKYVKYFDNEFYPKYIVYYTSKP